MAKKFATAINCMDGRVQKPVTEYTQKTFGVDYVDMITEPGPTRLFIGTESGEVERLRKKVLISVEAHGSALIALTAHGSCAGNPIPKEESIRQVREGMNIIRSWDLPVSIVGLWVDDEDWKVERIATL